MKSRSLKKSLCGGIFLAALCGSASANAQDRPLAPPPPATAPSPSGTADPAAPASDEKMVEARRQFEAGVSLLEDPDGAKYEDAYRAFKKAFDLSQSPKVLGNIAFCALHLERDGEAIDSYTSYLRDVPDISDRERTQIQRDLATMMATVARVRVVPTPAAPKGSIVVDRRTQTRGQVVENTYPLDGTEYVMRLRPGRHVLFVKNGASESAPFEATLEPGSELTMSPQEAVRRADQPPPVAPGSRSIAGPIVMGAVGVVGIGVGVVSGIVASNKTSDIESNCPGNVCPATYTGYNDARVSAKTFATVADVGFVGGGILLGGAVIWYLVTPKSPGSSPTTGSSSTWKSSLKPSAMCTHDGCGFNVAGGW